MPSITVPGFPAGFLPPGIFLCALFGGGSAAAGARQRKHVLFGNTIATTITGSAPTLAVAAGTASTNTKYFVASADDAATYFGRGSELHRMALRFFEQHPTGTLYAVAVPETSGSGGAAASATLTFVNACTGSVKLRLYLAGEVVEVSFAGTAASTVAIATMAEDVCDAVNARTELPMTAQFSAGVVTFTAKHMGTRGNALEFAAEWVRDSTITTIGSSATSSGASTTAALSSAGGVLTSGASGATAESIATALTKVDAEQFRVVQAQNDSTALGLLDAWLATQAGVMVQYRSQAVACSRASLATAGGVAVAQNNERLQLVWHYNSPTPCEEVAAQVAAARSIGDSAAGGVLVGEESDPNANLDGLRLVHVRAQRDAADAPTITEQNSAMGTGLAPLVPVAGGGTALLASVTTRCQDASAQPNYAVLQTSIVTSIDHVADELRRAAGIDFRGFRVQSDAEVVRTDRTTTPKGIKSWLKGKLKGFEEVGILRDVDALDDSLQVIEDSGSPGRILAEIPAKVVPGLHQLVGNVRQV